MYTNKPNVRRLYAFPDGNLSCWQVLPSFWEENKNKRKIYSFEVTAFLCGIIMLLDAFQFATRLTSTLNTFEII